MRKLASAPAWAVRMVRPFTTSRRKVQGHFTSGLGASLFAAPRGGASTTGTVIRGGSPGEGSVAATTRISGNAGAAGAGGDTETPAGETGSGFVAVTLAESG